MRLKKYIFEQSHKTEQQFKTNSRKDLFQEKKNIRLTPDTVIGEE